MLWSGWSSYFLWFTIPPVLFLNIWGPFQVHQLKLVSLWPKCSTAFLLLPSGKIQVFVYLFAFFYFHTGVRWNSKINRVTRAFFWTNMKKAFCPGFQDKIEPSVCKKNYVSHFLEQILVHISSCNMVKLHNSLWMTFPPIRA